jgi:hypothetical protein
MTRIRSGSAGIVISHTHSPRAGPGSHLSGAGAVTGTALAHRRAGAGAHRRVRVPTGPSALVPWTLGCSVRVSPSQSESGAGLGRPTRVPTGKGPCGPLHSD